VANAVTTEMEAMLIGAHAQHGGSLIRIDIARAAPVGAMTGWRPAMPVTQWSWVKPSE
jgi:precorrin-6Y C5,15-methyltransferase (decarboxylating)